MKSRFLDRVAKVLALLAVALLGDNRVHAGWSSLQANNRSPAPAHYAPPRPQPVAVPRPQPQAQPRPEAAAPRPEEARPNVRQDNHNGPPPDARDQNHFDNKLRPSPEEVDRARADQAERQRMDISEERRQAFFWSDYHAGMHIDRLPDGYRRIGVRGHPCFYFQGVFYDSGPSGVVVIAAPVDAVVPELPPGAVSVVVGDTVYYYAGGAFYLQQTDGTFIVVAAPIGVTVSFLPPDATSIIINGLPCFQSNGAYYEPVMQSGAIAYLTIPAP